MLHTDETRSSASEIKFLIDPALAPRIRKWARTHLQADPHGTGPCEDEYDTSSLYFDTLSFDVFHRRRSYGRAKYRVRRYGGSDMVFLERKLRRDGIAVKRRNAERMESLALLQRPTVETGWPGEWFHRRLLLRKLRPVCEVSYRRIARVATCPDGLARLTLDSGLRAVPTDVARFTLAAGVDFLQDRLILELKYGAHLPAVFRRLVEEFALATDTASKYRLAMAALGQVSLPDEGPVPRRAGTKVSYA